MGKAKGMIYNKKIIALRNIQKQDIAKAKCHNCGRISEPRIIGTAPSGWKKVITPPQGAVTYLCDKCITTSLSQ